MTRSSTHTSDVTNDAAHDPDSGRTPESNGRATIANVSEPTWFQSQIIRRPGLYLLGLPLTIVFTLFVLVNLGSGILADRGTGSARTALNNFTNKANKEMLNLQNRIEALNAAITSAHQDQESAAFRSQALKAFLEWSDSVNIQLVEDGQLKLTFSSDANVRINALGPETSEPDDRGSYLNQPVVEVTFRR